MERLLRIPLLGTMTAVVLALAWFLRPIDRSALFPVQFSDGTRGYVTADGRVGLEGPWSRVSAFDDSGLAIVEREEYAVIDRTGRTIAEGDYFDRFDESGLAHVRRDGRSGFVDRLGRLVIPTVWDLAYEFGTSDLARVKRGFEFGFIDRLGTLVVPAEWSEALPFDESGLAAVKKAERWGFIDRTGKIAIAVEWDEVRPFGGTELAMVAKARKWGAIDRTGKIAIPLQWDDAGGFDASGLGWVEKDHKTGFIDRNGEIAIPLEWDRASGFGKSSLAAVERAGKWGYIDRAGVVIPPRWKFANEFHPLGIAWVSEERFGVIDRSGRIVLPPRFDNGEFFVDKKTGTCRIFAWVRDPEDERSAWLRSLDSLAERVGWKQQPRVAFGGLYDFDGRLVWSSDWLSERSWMVLAGIAISLLLVVEVGWLISRNRGAA